MVGRVLVGRGGVCWSRLVVFDEHRLLKRAVVSAGGDGFLGRVIVHK